VVELLNEVSQYVQKNEPGTTRYQINVEMNKKSGVEEVIMIERSATLRLMDHMTDQFFQLQEQGSSWSSWIIRSFQSFPEEIEG
jgi:hypothetical protein